MSIALWWLTAAPAGVVDRVVPVVREHMVATTASRGPSRAAVRRLARRLAPAAMVEWSMVCGADHAGRGAGSGPNPTTAWLDVAASAGVARRPVAVPGQPTAPVRPRHRLGGQPRTCRWGCGRR